LHEETLQVCDGNSIHIKIWKEKNQKKKFEGKELIEDSISDLTFLCNDINRIKPLNRTGTNNTRDNHTQWIPMIPVKGLHMTREYKTKPNMRTAY
jgi:hypothetical protein